MHKQVATGHRCKVSTVVKHFPALRRCDHRVSIYIAPEDQRGNAHGRDGDARSTSPRTPWLARPPPQPLTKPKHKHKLVGEVTLFDQDKARDVQRGYANNHLPGRECNKGQEDDAELSVRKAESGG